MLPKLVLFFAAVFILSSCSSEDESLVSEFPIAFVIDTVTTTGMRTYYFTDTIVYRVDNLQDLDSLSNVLDSLTLVEIANRGTNGDEFVITQLELTSPLEATITYYNGGAITSSNTTYILERNIGSIKEPFLFNFKLNEDLSRLLSCYSNIATRTVDTLYEGQDPLFPMLDTFEVDDIRFQLIPTDGAFTSGFCNPTNESTEMKLYANENGLQNNDRIIIHRLDLLFKPL